MDHPFRGLRTTVLLFPALLLGHLAGLLAWGAWPAVAAPLAAASLLLAAARRAPRFLALLLAGLCGVLAAGRLSFVDPWEVSPFLSGEVLLRGRVEALTPSDDGWGATAEGVEISRPDRSRSLLLRRVRLTVRNPAGSVPLPAEVRAVGRLSRIRSPGRPGEIPREWGALAAGVQFRFDAHASRTVFLPAAEEGGGGPGGPFLYARHRTGEFLSSHAGGSDGALYLRSLATGEVPPPSHPLTVLLRRTGLAHLLAISGTNVAVFFAVQAVLIRVVAWVFRRRHGTPDLVRLSAQGALPGCWAYVLMAGAPLPAVRAAAGLSAAVLFWSRTGSREPGAAWTAAAWLALGICPWVVFSPSFLLSYGAAFFLLASLAGFSGAGSRRPSGKGARAAERLQRAGAASAAAFLGTLPVSGTFFLGMPAGAILWNLLFGPVLGGVGVVGAFLAATGGAFSLSFLGFPVRAVTVLLDVALGALFRLSGGGSGYFPLPPAGWLPMVACTAVSGIGSLALRARGRSAGPAVLGGAGAFLLWIHLPYAALPPPGPTLLAWRANGGAAVLLSLPSGKRLLVVPGAAAPENPEARDLAPVLRGEGVVRIDALVVLGPDRGLASRIAALAGSFDVGEIWLSGGTSPDLLAAAAPSLRGTFRRDAEGVVLADRSSRVRVRAVPARSGSGRKERSVHLEAVLPGMAAWIPSSPEAGRGSGRSAGDVPPGRPSVAVLCRERGPPRMVLQITDCLGSGNLVPSPQVFLLENGAFTARSGGKTATVSQDGGLRFWRLLLRDPSA